jgi:hypothetical protein
MNSAFKKTVSSKEDNKALFVAYEAADQEAMAAKAVYEAALVKRSEAVKAIYARMGKGPYKFREENGVIIAVRGETYFFRANRKKDLQDIFFKIIWANFNKLLRLALLFPRAIIPS